MHSTPTSLSTDMAKALPKLLPPLAVAHVDTRRIHSPFLVVTVRTPSGRRRTLHVELIADGSPSRMPQAIHRLRAVSRSGYPIVASRFLSPRARVLCKEAGVGYLDLAGNCHVRFDDLYLEKAVDKNPFPRRGRAPTFFTPVSSRVLRVMLEEPKRSWQVGALAHMADVSLGQTSNLCRRLIDEAYAARVERRVRLIQPAALLEAWREAHALRHHYQATYYSFEKGPERLMTRLAQVAAKHRWQYAVTSFGAASLVAPFVRGVGILQWYVSDADAVDGWVKALDLRPVEAGPNVVMRLPYDPGMWHRAHPVSGVTVVGNIQLYLDLWDEPGRGREQAEFLRAKRIGF